MVAQGFEVLSKTPHAHFSPRVYSTIAIKNLYSSTLL